MRHASGGFRLVRRRFLFWLGLAVFSLGETLRADSLDELAAAITRSAEPPQHDPPAKMPEHWTVAGNRTWRWYERETLIDGRWKLTGITTPVNRQTGEPYSGRAGYLDETLVPSELRRGASATDGDDHDGATDDRVPGQPDATRRARHGRPPSKWLRSLRAEELRIWLKSIDVPEAGVSGMSFFTHLTRDHSFEPENIIDLSIDEQAKLHAAAHYGF